MSGKAKQDTVPPARTAIWEVTLYIEESEGHKEFAASLLQGEGALAAPKRHDPLIASTKLVKPIPAKELTLSSQRNAGVPNVSAESRSAEQCIFVAQGYQAVSAMAFIRRELADL